MAELKPLGRSVSTPSAPDISGAAQAPALLGRTAQTFASNVGEHIKERREAALEMESAFNILAGQREMALSMFSAQKNPNPSVESLGEFNKTQQEIIKKILENTDEKNYKHVATSLVQFANQNELKLMEHAYQRGQQKLKDNDATLFYEGIQQLSELYRDGRFDEGKQTFLNIDSSRKKAVEAGLLSQEDYKKGKDLFLQSAINGELEYEYNKAYEENGERGAAAFLKKYWESPTDLRSDQKELGMKFLHNLDTQRRQASAQASAIGRRDVIESLYENPTQDMTEVDARIEASAIKGFSLNEAQAFSVRQRARKLSESELKQRIKNQQITKDVQTSNVNALIKYSGTDLNNWYVDTVDKVKEFNAEQEEEAETIGQAIMAQKPDWMVKAAVASEMPKAIPYWQDELHSQIWSKNYDDVLNAVKAYDYVKQKNLAGIEGFSEKDVSFIRAVSNDLKHTTMAPNEIIDRRKDEILNADDKVRKNREDALKVIHKDKPSIPIDIVKEAYGVKPDNLLKDPGSALYATAQEQFDQEYMASGDEKAAKQAAIEFLKDTGGESIFAPKNHPVWNPPENLPFYDFGNIVRNQATKFLHDVVKTANENPDRMLYKVELSDKMPQMPTQVSEQDLVDRRYDKGEWWLKIDGTDRRVFFISQNYNQANYFPGTAYQVMFEKGGTLHNLQTVVPALTADGNLSTQVDSATITFLSPQELVPNVITDMEAKRARIGLTRAAMKLHDDDSFLNRPLVGDVFSVTATSQLSAAKRAKKDKGQIIEEEKSRIKERLDTEKLKRLSYDVKRGEF